MSTTTLAPSKVTARDPKGLKFVSIVEAAYNKAGLAEEEAQRVNDTPGLSDLISEFIADNRSENKYVGEEVNSSYTYPEEYKGPKPIEVQIEAIAEIFGLDPAKALEYVKNLPALPENAEGWFAIPSVDALAAKYFFEVIDPAEKYCRAVQLAHKKIADSRSFKNWREGQIDTAHLRVHPRTLDAMAMISRTQVGDIYIIVAQLGMRHKGRSVRRARECFVANEFGLGSLVVGSIVLVHPERLVRWEELDMDCAGDEFSDDGDGRFGRAPYFFFDDRAKFGACSVDYPYVYYGSASAFLPQ